MRMLSLAGATLVATVSVTTSSAPTRPYPLVTLPYVGAVTWRCDPRTNRYALAIRIDGKLGATSQVTFAAAHRHSVRTLQPGEKTAFPFTRARVQRLVVLQSTEARALRATVTATFERDRDYCFPYFLPGLSVRVG
jgi:hypothetical protein